MNYPRPMSPVQKLHPLNMFRVWGGEGEREDPNAGGDGGDGGDGGELTPEQKKIQELEAANEELTKKHKDADKQAKDFQKQIQDKEREGMEDAQRTEAERDDYKAKYEALAKLMETSYLDTAIAKLSNAKQKDGSPKYDWNDADAVRAFLDMDAIKLDIDTGEVDGLKEQLSAIAKDKPWMLVQPQTEGEGSGSYTPPDQRSTGNHPNGGSARQRTTDDKKLASKYKFNHLVPGGAPR